MQLLTETDTLNKRLSKKLILYYSILFLIIGAGVFSVFIIFGRSFMQYGDAMKQGFFWLAEFKHNFNELLKGEPLPLWTWSRGLGMQINYRLDFFNLIASFFPIKYFELGYSIALALKLYCGGLAYLIFARDLKMDDFKCLAGSICYIFSTWFVSVTMVQGTFMFLAMMMPLLMMSIDRIYRGKSPVMFIIVVGYFLARDAYIAYMAAIAAIIYMLLRYFTYNDSFSFKDYFGWIGRFIVYGVTAALLSSAFMIQFTMATLGASMESPNNAISLFYSPSFYYGFGRTLMTGGFTSGYTYLGIPILAMLVLPLALKRISLKNTHSLMALIFLAMTIFPFFSHLFNGFGYSTGRWYFLVVFFLNLATLDLLDIEKLRSKNNMIVMIVWLVILAVWTLGFDAAGLIGLPLRAKAFIGLNLLSGFAIIFVIYAVKSEKITIRHRQAAVLIITGLMLMTGWSMSFYLNQNKFIPVGETSQRLSQSVQRVSAKIDDEDFYRTDQVSWINLSHDIQMPANENLYWGAKSIYGYDSFINSDQIEFNRLTGNSYSHVMRVYTLSNDNRMGLDFLYGVKYFLGDDSKSEETGSDQYAGYGFKYDHRIDGVNIFKNKYASGLGFGYDKYISKKEFRKLSRLEREQALLQAIVLPDRICAASNSSTLSGMKELKASQIDRDIKNVPYKIINTDGLTIKGNKITTSKDMASMTIKVGDVKNSQLMISFDNLYRTDGKSIDVFCENKRLTEIVRTGSSNQCLANVVDFDMNMGYYDEFSDTIKITFHRAAEYNFDRLYLSAMSSANYDKYATERLKEKYNITFYSDSNVQGTVNMKNDGILYFSIPQYKNWDVYVDGAKAKKIKDVNIAFMGVKVPEGTHSVELKYHNTSLTAGIIISLIGAVLTVLIGLVHRRRTGIQASDSKK